MIEGTHSSKTTTSPGIQSVQIKLAALWTSLMFLYIYADIFSFYRPGAVEKIIEGYLGPFEATQTSLSVAAILMLIPCLMVAGSFVFSIKGTRILTIVMGSLFSLVNIANVIGESWVYYLVYGAFELLITITIVRMAWKWKIDN